MSLFERANRTLTLQPDLVDDLVGPGPVLGAEVVGSLRRPMVVASRLDSYGIERIECVRVSPDVVRQLANKEV